MVNAQYFVHSQDYALCVFGIAARTTSLGRPRHPSRIDPQPPPAKIYIKDVKSSNGTFINGERLSPEGLESEPYELKTDDIVVRLFPSPRSDALSPANRPYLTLVGLRLCFFPSL